MFAPSRRSPTGWGAPDVQLLLLTPSGQLAGVGEVGELYVRSPHLAAGYVDDDALTAANFRRQPFHEREIRPAVSYRRSGSVFARWQRRMGRPYRPAREHPRFPVELAEVEAALSQCAGVRYAAVVADEFFSGRRPRRHGSRG